MSQQGIKDRWHQLLQQWSQCCPQCGETWLIINAHENEWHTCKSCGHRFAISQSHRHVTTGEAKEEDRKRHSRAA